jgi:hypothetical protein
MSDVVVTVPKRFGWQNWLDEGDLPGDEPTGEEWHFYLGGYEPRIQPGERVYIVHNGALRGYAPLAFIDPLDCDGRFSLVRFGGAVAVTIPEKIGGFRGWRYRWWDRAIERPFPDWQNPNADPTKTTPENDDE